MTRPPDVWDWSVEDVTNFLRTDAVEYIRRDAPHATLPSLDQLAQKFVENSVEGVALLTAVDAAFLKDDCGIKVLGERNAYWRCIKNLQGSSSRYSTKDEPIALPTPNSDAPPAQTFERQATPVAHRVIASPPDDHFRQHEHYIDDERGRKRRRLDLSAVTSLSNNPPSLSSNTASTGDTRMFLSVDSHPIDIFFFGNTALGSAVSARPPSHPLFINDGEDEESDDYQYVNSRTQYGLAQYAHQCTKHFLFSPEEASLTRRSQEALVVYPYRDGMNSGENLAASKVDPHGRLVPGASRCAFVVQHAPDTAAAAHLSDEGRIAITKESEAMINSNALDLGYSAEDAAQIGGEYDHLLVKWQHQDGDLELTAFPQSDDDATTGATDVEADPDDESGDDLAEVDDESEAGQFDPSAVIDTAIEHFREEWHEKKLPALARKEAWSVWTKMKKSRTIHSELVRGAQRVIDQLDGRMLKYRDDLTRMQWDGEASLRRQCEMLEPTVHDREKELWKISIWSASQAPTPPNRTHHKPSHASGKAAQLPGESGSTLQDALHALGPDDRMHFSPQRDVSAPTNHPPGEPVVSAFADDKRSTTAEPDEPLAATGDDDIVMSDEVLEDEEQPEDMITDSDNILRSDTINHDIEMPEECADSPEDVAVSGPRSASPRAERDDDDDDDPDPPRSFRRLSGISRVSSTRSSGSSEPIKEEIADDAAPAPSNGLQAPRTPVGLKPQCIDLTMSTDSSAGKSIARRVAKPVEKPKRKAKGAAKSQTPPARSKPMLAGDIVDATAAEVDEWDYDRLSESRQRKHLLIKMLKDAGPAVRDAIWYAWQELANRGFREKLITALLHITDEDGMRGVLEMHHVAVMQKCAHMAYVWFRCAPPNALVEPDTVQELLGTDDQIHHFVTMLRGLLQKRGSTLFVPQQSATQADPYEIDSDEDLQGIAGDVDGEDEEQYTVETPSTRHGSAKKRRKVKQDAVAKTRRANAIARNAEFTEVQSQFSSNPALLSDMIATDSSHSGLEINPMRKDGDPQIFIDQRIAHVLKPYQHEGIRFLWREITATDEITAKDEVTTKDEIAANDSVGSQGAVLAHTMGLGKTLQSIALLTAIDETSQSRIAKIRHQLPLRLQVKGNERRKRMRRLRLLILCPALLLSNWLKEIEKWTPSGFGGRSRIFLIHSTVPKNKNERPHTDTLQDWYQQGGILLIGHTLFRILVMADQGNEGSEAPRKPSKAPKLLDTPEHRALIKQTLLDGTDLVVVDEAHALKDADSQIARAASKIKTESRLALTGTPMSNDVDEIFSLISWVAPGYLGQKAEFSDRFANPIKAGLYTESTPTERRISKMKLTVLHREIEPKIHRADITVLRGSLKPKVEFVITVELTAIQRAAYSKYVTAITGAAEGIDDVSQVRIFGWLNVLFLLNNHPTAYRQKMLQTLDPKKAGNKIRKRRSTTIQELEEAADDNASVSTVDVAADAVTPEDAADEEEEVLSGLGFDEATIRDLVADLADVLDPTLSAKVSLLLRIVELSIACDDQILLFSHRLPTLDYLERVFATRNIRFGRIDGSVLPAKRPAILKEFADKRFQILLISTRAGGQGLNIQCANRVILFDFSFNPSHEEQAIGRAYRLGQTKPVFVYRLLAGGTFEMNLYNKALFKTDLAQRVVDKRKPNRKAQRDMTKWVYHPRVVAHKDLNLEHGKDRHVLDKIIDAQSAREHKDASLDICSIDTMETLQQEEVDEEPLNEEELRRVEEEMQWHEENRNNRKQGLPEVMPRGLEPPPAPALVPVGLASVSSTAPIVGAHPNSRAVPMNATQATHGVAGPQAQQPINPITHAWMAHRHEQNNAVRHHGGTGKDVRNNTFQDGFAQMSITPPTMPPTANGRSSPDHGVHGLPTLRRG